VACTVGGIGTHRVDPSACGFNGIGEGKRSLVQAEIGGIPNEDIRRLRLNIDQACGTNLDVILDARRKRASESHGLPDHVALGSLLADMGDFAAADQTHSEELRAQQDVSPFPVAWGLLSARHSLGRTRAEAEPVPCCRMVPTSHRRFAGLHKSTDTFR
jgi:hypothetical protein